MRIAVIGSGTASRELPPHLATLGGDGVAAQIVNPRLSTFAYTPYDKLLVDVGYVDAAQSAADDGCDAVFINSFADYGIEAAAAALAVPVIGAGAATLAAAAADGASFAIVTVWPRSMGFLYAERLRALALADRCVGVWHVSPETELARLGAENGVMQRMARGDADVIDRLAEACATAQAQGAQSIALGCTCMAPIGPALQQRSALPVLEASRCGFLAAVAAARLRRADAGNAAAVRDPGRIPRLVDCWAGAGQVAEPECPVCISH